MDIAVIYLFWVPYGKQHLNDFIESYLQHEAGYDHKLIIVFNGTKYADESEIDAYVAWLGKLGIQNLNFLYFEQGFDIDIYKKAAKNTSSDFFLFLNTYSRIKSSYWLNHYCNNFKSSTGIIGATASLASYYSSVKEQTIYELKQHVPVLLKYKKIKYLIKLYITQRTNFRKFPAPHIRTNAFFISKKIFLRIEGDVFRNKMDTYHFENGKNSLTSQVLKLGLDCLVIDKNGKSFQQSEWMRSKTFWVNNQEGLLIEDNQTIKYQEASTELKKLYTRIAWGK